MPTHGLLVSEWESSTSMAVHKGPTACSPNQHACETIYQFTHAIRDVTDSRDVTDRGPHLHAPPFKRINRLVDERLPDVPKNYVLI